MIKTAKVKRICEQCSASFETYPSLIKEGKGKFCSRKCANKSREKKVKRICQFCGESFKIQPNKIKRGLGIFCSKKCRINSQKRQKIQICKECGKKFETKISRIKNNRGKFCSRECYTKWKSKNSGGKNNPSWRGGKIKRICEVCGRNFEVTPYVIKVGEGKYCSVMCSRKRRKMPKHHTKPECIFEQICKNNNLPFKYTGDGTFWIGKNPSVNPDFIECNSKKIAVEIFSYWHDPLRRFGKVPYSGTYEGRKKILKEYGWQLVVFWDTDLLRKDAETFILSQLNTVLK